ncbi:hypothetical protein BSM4216_2753 [Bacillus smithii]|nr:hypothetical protein BSM4216_2753 [Bacillus smithii]
MFLYPVNFLNERMTKQFPMFTKNKGLVLLKSSKFKVKDEW